MKRVLGCSLASLPTILLLWALACDQATGTVKGGQALISQPTGCAANCTDATWTCLYDNCFGPSGLASCSTAQGTCHSDGSQVGSQISGFVCGATKDSCWQGMVVGQAGSFPPIVPCLSAAGAAGAAGDAGDGGETVNLCAPDAGGLDPTTTQLYTALHQAPSSTDNTLCGGNVTFACNMPCGDPTSCHTKGATYTFTPDDLARIAAWITQGALDN